MAEKVMESPLLLKTPISSERIISNHTKLRKMGFPVIPTMRIVDTPKGEDERILVTDLTEGGKKDVYSGSFEPGYDHVPSFDISNAEEVTETLRDLYLKCRDSGVLMNHYDVFFLVVDKETKKANVIAGDISRVSFPDITNTEELDWVESLNYGSFQTFIEHMNLCLTGKKIDFSPIRTILREKKCS